MPSSIPPPFHCQAPLRALSSLVPARLPRLPRWGWGRDPPLNPQSAIRNAPPPSAFSLAGLRPPWPGCGSGRGPLPWPAASSPCKKGALPVGTFGWAALKVAAGDSTWRTVPFRLPPFPPFSAFSLAGLRPLPWPAASSALKTPRSLGIPGRPMLFLCQMRGFPAQNDLRASAGSYAHKGMHMAWMEKVRNWHQKARKSRSKTRKKSKKALNPR